MRLKVGAPCPCLVARAIACVARSVEFGIVKAMETCHLSSGSASPTDIILVFAGKFKVFKLSYPSIV